MKHVIIPIEDNILEKLQTEFDFLRKGGTPAEMIENLSKRERILGKMEILTKGKVISFTDLVATFNNSTDCYADTWVTEGFNLDNGTTAKTEGPVIPAMTLDGFKEFLMKIL